MIRSMRFWGNIRSEETADGDDMASLIVTTIVQMVERNLDWYFSEIEKNPEKLIEVLAAAINERESELKQFQRERNTEEIVRICGQIVRITLASLRPQKFKSKRSGI